jgi:exopolyphosphatase/guanosine-5'-triphosphate,3'-diphosphate pyrophosphatase
VTASLQDGTWGPVGEFGYGETMPVYAALDIGSNSIKMLCAEATASGVHRVLADDRQVTRIGQSVFAEGIVNAPTRDLVLSVLRRMGETCRSLDPVGIRAVATSAVRDARNQDEFLRRASDALGAEIEIISGLEEARLVHLGVVSSVNAPRSRSLLIDVGGGSAEFILSDQCELINAFSKPLGAVRLWQTFLTSDPPDQVQLQQLSQYLDEKIQNVRAAFGIDPIHLAIGSSSTALAMVCAILGIPRSSRQQAAGRTVSLSQIQSFYQRLASLPLHMRRQWIGIGPRRAEIILPGVALFRRALEVFGIQELQVSSAGVREGVMVDLACRGVGKERMTLTPEQRTVVESLTTRYGVSLPHARQVGDYAVDIFGSLEPLHRLPHVYGRLLEAAGHLLDIGHYISATKHHKHSLYLVSNVELPGFTGAERRMIALLCRYHRKAMPSASHPEYTERSDEEKAALRYLIPILRLADALNCTRSQKVQALRCLLGPEDIVVKIRHHEPVDLELWTARHTAEMFRTIYRRNLVLEADWTSPACSTSTPVM